MDKFTAFLESIEDVDPLVSKVKEAYMEFGPAIPGKTYIVTVELPGVRRMVYDVLVSPYQGDGFAAIIRDGIQKSLSGYVGTSMKRVEDVDLSKNSTDAHEDEDMRNGGNPITN